MGVFILKWGMMGAALATSLGYILASRMRRLFCSKKQISATGHTTLPEAAQFPVDARAKHISNKKALAVSRKGLKRKRHLHHYRCLDSLLASPRGFEPLSTA